MDKTNAIMNADGIRNWQANILLDNIKRLEQENAELKAENERLKAKIKDKSCPFYFKHTGVCLGRKDEMFKYDLCKSHQKCNIKQMAKENRQYYQTLQEVKAIANINAVNTCWSILHKCDTCKEAKECGLQSPLEKLKTILELITKAEKDDE